MARLVKRTRGGQRSKTPTSFTGTMSRTIAKKPRTIFQAFAALKWVSGNLHQVISWGSVLILKTSPAR